MNPSELDALFAALPHPQCIALRDDGTPCQLLHSQTASTGWFCDKHYDKTSPRYSKPPLDPNELTALQLIGRETRAIAALRAASEVSAYMDIQRGDRCFSTEL